MGAYSRACYLPSDENSTGCVRIQNDSPRNFGLTWGSAPHPGSVACGDPNAPRRSLAGARVRAQPITPLPYAVGPWQLSSWRNKYEILVSRRITDYRQAHGIHSI